MTRRARGPVRALFGKELTAMWATPLPYVAGAVFHAALAMLFMSELQARRQAALAPLVPVAGFLLLVIVPVVAARTVAEERRLGTLELLDAIPVPRAALIGAKWAASAVTALVLLAPAAGFAALLSAWAEPDRAPMYAGLAGLALLALALAAVGVAASAASTQQAVAALVAVALGMALWFAHVEPGQVRTATLLGRFSISERLRSFAGGALDSGDIGFFVLLTVVALALAVALVVPGGAVAARRRAFATAAIVTLLAVTALGAVDRSGWSHDLTQDHSLSLSDATGDVLRAVHGSVKVTAAVSEDRGRSEATALLGRYRKRNRNVRFRVFGPGESPGEMRRLGIDPVLGGVALERGGRVEHAPDVSEQDLTAALARLVRGRSPAVCIASGHGENDPAATIGEGWRDASTVLSDNGYNVRSLDLLREPSVPAGCNALVLSAPTAPLGPAQDAIAAYLLEGGSALVIADPASTVDLSPLVAMYGLRFQRGVVFEGDDARRLPGDPVSPVVRQFRSGFPVVRRLAPVFFPGAQQVEVLRAPDGVVSASMGATSTLAFLERNPADEGFDAGVDAPGPIDLLAAADASIPDGAKLRRSRVVAVSDADWATNALVGQAGHARLLVQALDWLTLDESLVSVSPHVPRLRALDLSAARLRYARLLMAGLVPLIFLSTGLAVWGMRRGV